jgi:hypothetical protein
MQLTIESRNGRNAMAIGLMRHELRSIDFILKNSLSNFHRKDAKNAKDIQRKKQQAW